METSDEYFYHPAQVRTPGGSPGHGRYNIRGVGLPDEVLRKIYYENALRPPAFPSRLPRATACRKGTRARRDALGWETGFLGRNVGERVLYPDTT